MYLDPPENIRYINIQSQLLQLLVRKVWKGECYNFLYPGLIKRFWINHHEKHIDIPGNNL